MYLNIWVIPKYKVLRDQHAIFKELRDQYTKTPKKLKHEKLSRCNSRKLKPNELKWIVFEKELYTIRLA